MAESRNTGQSRGTRAVESTTTERAITRWRKEIDAIDDQLLALLNQRANCSIEIGWIKRAASLEIYVPQREVQIIDRMKKSNRGPLRPEAVRRLFERIIDESRSTERIVCEGVENPSPKTSKKRRLNKRTKPR